MKSSLRLHVFLIKFSFFLRNKPLYGKMDFTLTLSCHYSCDVDSKQKKQYLVVLYHDAENYYSTTRRNSDVPHVWTEILTCRVWTSKNL